MRFLFLVTMFIAAPALAQTTTTNCLMIGNMLQCNSTSPQQQPLPALQVNPNAFADAFQRGQQMAQQAALQAQQQRLLAEQTEQLRIQNEQLRQGIRVQQSSTQEAPHQPASNFGALPAERADQKLIAAQVAALHAIYTNLQAEQHAKPEGEQVFGARLRRLLIDRAYDDLGYWPDLEALSKFESEIRTQ